MVIFCNKLLAVRSDWPTYGHETCEVRKAVCSSEEKTSLIETNRGILSLYGVYHLFQTMLPGTFATGEGDYWFALVLQPLLLRKCISWGSDHLTLQTNLLAIGNTATHILWSPLPQYVVTFKHPPTAALWCLILASKTFLVHTENFLCCL